MPSRFLKHNEHDNWLTVVREELPTSGSVVRLRGTVGAPTSSADFGVPASENGLTFKMTKDIRDKYILSTLLFDMGELDEEAERVYP